MQGLRHGLDARGRPTSVMVYCGDALGLGHLRRATAIVSRFVREVPGSNALLLTSLPTGNFFECPKGVDVIKLPSLKKDENGRLVSRKLNVHERDLQQLRTSLIGNLTESFRPDLLLVDHLPTGVRGELLPALRAMKARERPPSIVLGLRDILDDPTITTERWTRQDVYRTIDRYYDAVLVYGSQEVFDTSRQYRLDRGAKGVTHCGYVCAEDVPSAPSSRSGLGLGDGKLVVITAGGGADGHAMMKLCLGALRELDVPSDLEVVCITGPFMARDEIEDLRARSAGLPARVLWCVERAPRYFAAADLIVTMAGYNTLMEVIRLRKPTLVLPRRGPSAEQRMRTEIFSRRGVVRGVREEEREPRALARLLMKALAGGPPPETLPEMNGLETAVKRLKELVTARKSRHRAREIADSIGGPDGLAAG